MHTLTLSLPYTLTLSFNSYTYLYTLTLSFNSYMQAMYVHMHGGLPPQSPVQGPHHSAPRNFM